MSVSALAQAAFDRRADVNLPAVPPPVTFTPAASAAPVPAATHFESAASIAAPGPNLFPPAAAGPVPIALTPAPRVATVPEEKPSKVQSALDLLFGYIPGEVLTLYVAVLA